MQFSESTMLTNLSATTRDEVLHQLGTAVIEAGLARKDYVDALLERESSFPTGLPISGGVAIPHTSAEFVMGDTIAVATLAEPVEFSEMGGDPDQRVEVSTVFMLVISDGSRQVPVLSKLIKKLQSGALVEDVRKATGAAEITSVLDQHFSS